MNANWIWETPWSSRCWSYALLESVTNFITPFLKSLVVPVIWLALIDAIYSRIAPIFCFKSHLLPSQLGSYTKKQNNLSDFKSCLKLPITLQENERQRVSCGKFCNFCFQNSYFFPCKNGWMNFRPAQYCINKIFELTKSFIWAISKWI